MNATELKNKTINAIIELEQGYVNNPDDSGGETRYGITKKVARENGYSGDMQDLPRLKAFQIYEKKYWHTINADRLSELSIMVTEEVTDTAVNTGPEKAATFLQRALNILNKKQDIYRDIIADGKIGPVTIDALHSYLTFRDEKTLTKILNLYQGAFYIELTERREKDESFIYGWARKRVVL